MTALECEQVERDFMKLREDMMTKLKKCITDFTAHGFEESAQSLKEILSTLEALKTPAQFLGWVGGNTSVKPGSRRRGRPSKAVE